MKLPGMKLIRHAVIFILCFVIVIMVSCYGMPLNSITTSLVDYGQQLLSPLQDDIYECGADPATFASLLIVMGAYSVILYVVVIIIRKSFSPLINLSFKRRDIDNK